MSNTEDSKDDRGHVAGGAVIKRPNRKKVDPSMARTGSSNGWTVLKPEAVAWIKTVGMTKRAEWRLPWADIRNEMERRFGCTVTVSNLTNIAAGRAWAWMDKPEEYADDDTKLEIKELKRVMRATRRISKGGSSGTR